MCLQQAAWCHSWRAQPPETSYTPARRVAHTGLQTHEMIGCFWCTDDLAVFKACSNTDSNMSTNHVNRRFVCLQILCLLFSKEAKSYIYMHLSGFPIHSYLCTFSFACPSLHSTLVYLFFSQFSLPTPGRPIEVSAQSAVRLISPWISKSPAGPADSCTNLGRIEARGGNDYSARRKMIKANSSRTGKGCKQCHRYAFVWGLFTSWPG